MLEQVNSTSHAAQAGSKSPKPINPTAFSENLDGQKKPGLGFPDLPDPTPEEMLEKFPRNENFTHYQVKHVSPVWGVEVVLFASCSDVAEAQMRGVYKDNGCDLFQVSLTRSGIEAGKGYFCYPGLYWTCQVSDRGLITWLPLHSNPKDLVPGVAG